ncbi:MAG: hypothetical protein E7058_06965 [Lentisphaerae bacterium]|nr:hypothetical protein [Lentisphaerota bacterium]
MKIAWFKEIISPEVGAYIAGYSINDKSVAKLDDLYMTGLCMDDGTNRVLLVSFDLLGLDDWYIRKIRKNCAAILNVPESAVMFTCTHTHSGPETRSLAGHPEQLNLPYLEKLSGQLAQAVAKTAAGEFQEVDTYFYSQLCEENRNRCYVTADNHGSFTAHRREVVPIARGFADQELGEIFFTIPGTPIPVYVIGNFAAHPLASHSPGLGGIRISADYPGAFRNYITSETGAEAMFVTGAAGDLVPLEDEQGSEAAVSAGRNIAKAVIKGIVDAPRNPARFRMPDAKVGSLIKTFNVKLRDKYRRKSDKLPASYLDKDCVDLELQFLAVGDVGIVGVPGELCCSIGQEIKWHSPFRRTMIAYNSTAYFSYIGHANMLVGGGYEALSQRCSARGGLQLLNTAADGLFELRSELYPDDGENYPDDLIHTLVNIPPNK